MPRPRIRRRVRFNPNVTYFKPQGLPLRSLEEVRISKEELAAFRLIEIEKLSQQEASQRMEVSQPTFFRTLKGAREKIADALVNGKAIRIE